MRSKRRDTNGRNEENPKEIFLLLIDDSKRKLWWWALEILKIFIIDKVNLLWKSHIKKKTLDAHKNLLGLTITYNQNREKPIISNKDYPCNFSLRAHAKLFSPYTCKFSHRWWCHGEGIVVSLWLLTAVSRQLVVESKLIVLVKEGANPRISERG